MRVLAHIVAALGIAWALLHGAPSWAQQPVTPYLQQQRGPGGPVSHVHSAVLESAHLFKDNPGTLGGYNCTAITGGAAGYCVAYDASSIPASGALTGANVIDVCYFDTGARGCSLAHLPNGAIFQNGIVVLITSASTPFTYTTGTDTGFISGDYN